MIVQPLIIFFITFTVNENLQKVADNLTHYVKYESWKFCEKCHIVEPNKILPTYGNQKLTHKTSCICTKGRYFVPMVRVFLSFISKTFKTVIYYIYIYIYIIYIYVHICIYIYVALSIYLYLSIYVYITYLKILIYLSIYMYICIYLCVYQNMQKDYNYLFQI